MADPRKPRWPEIERPVIYISPKAKQKLDAYIAVAPGEIAGMGTAGIIGPNRFLITEIFIFKQKVNGAEAELDQEDMARWLFDWIQAGKDTNSIKSQWHSHVNMGCFWSVTDLDNIDGFDNGMNDWMLSIVGTKSGQYMGRLDIYHPVRVYFDKLPVITALEIEAELRAAVAAEVKAKVAEKPVATVVPYVKIKKGPTIGAKNANPN
jgi:hypothetical protein